MEVLGLRVIVMTSLLLIKLIVALTKSPLMTVRERGVIQPIARMVYIHACYPLKLLFIH
jgi:hypothetical protein